MKVYILMLTVAFAMSSASTVFAGSSCCPVKKKAEKSECGYTKGSEECKEACAKDKKEDAECSSEEKKSDS